MISFRAPKIFILCPSQAELAVLFGLLRSVRSTFSPSFTAQILATDAEAPMGHSSCVKSNATARLLTFARIIENELLNWRAFI
jgi:hypothetical protein